MRGIFSGIFEWIVIAFFRIIGRQIGLADVLTFLFWSAAYVCVVALVRLLYLSCKRGSELRQLSVALSIVLLLFMLFYIIGFFSDGRAAFGILLAILCTLGAWIGIRLGDNLAIKLGHTDSKQDDDIIDAEIIEPRDFQVETSKDSMESNNKIYCIHCGAANIKEANFCASCGKKMQKDSKDFSNNMESSVESSIKTKGILKFSGLFQVLIGLHGLFAALVCIAFFVSILEARYHKDNVFGFLLLGVLCYIFYQYFRYKKTYAYYTLLVLFGLFCIIFFFGMFGSILFLIPFAMYCCISWYLYESLKQQKSK